MVSIIDAQMINNFLTHVDDSVLVYLVILSTLLARTESKAMGELHVEVGDRTIALSADASRGVE